MWFETVTCFQDFAKTRQKTFMISPIPVALLYALILTAFQSNSFDIKVA